MRFVAKPISRTASALALFVLLGSCLSFNRAPDQTPKDVRQIRVSLKMENASVQDAFAQLFKAAGVTGRVDESIRGTVTVDLQDDLFPAAMDKTLSAAEGTSLTYDVEGGVYTVTRQPAENYRRMARSAVSDLLSHFWNGDATDGNVMDPADWPDAKARGWLWGRATFICTLEDLYYTTRDPRLLQYLRTDWAYLQSVFSPEELVSVGKVGVPERMVQNTAHDDAGWTCMMYLSFYRATADRFALECAKRLFLNACKRWSDPIWNGGLSYDDSHAFTSSYQAALLLCGIRLFELSGDTVYWSRAMKIYRWMESSMARADGLYWWIFENGAPRKLGVIREACSETFLGGNMAMGVVNARLYRDTGEDKYRLKALRTADDILSIETDGKGHLLDDRDAWANGLFMGEWVREVLALPGISKGEVDLVRRSARAVYSRARTTKGYYGGCWNGPAEGDGCAWIRTDGAGSNGLKSIPQQLMVSSNAVNVIVAAAAVEGRKPWLEPRTPPTKL